MSLPSHPRRHPDAAYKLVDDEALIVMAGEGGVHHVLNAVGACIWEMLDGAHDLAAIRARLTDEFEVDEETADRDLRDFLKSLQEHGMLDDSGS